MTNHRVPRVFGLLQLLSASAAAQTTPGGFQPPENQSVTPVEPLPTLATAPSVTASALSPDSRLNLPSLGVRRNDWWPPSEQDILQTSPYTPEIQPVAATYYAPPPSPPVFPHYRSDSWKPFGYPDFGYPMVSPNANNQMAMMSPKYMTVGLFIGLLTLLAIIQSTISAKAKASDGDVLQSREKRDLSLSDFEHLNSEQRDIFHSDAKVRCIQRTVCLENSQLLKDFGPKVAKLAKYLTRSVKKSLWTASGWGRLVEDAGAAGLRGEDCNVLYRDCVLPVEVPY